MISPADLARVGEAVLLDPTPAALRRRFPALHFSACAEDDLNPRYRSAFSVGDFELYLIAGASGHCLELTNDPAAATGLLIASRADES
ncbi:MAG: hypothetical protein FIB06_01715 [Betaproteobacteria bacterium]|nr:hypothetical protein [Betaproteobacteria bacterium]